MDEIQKALINSDDDFLTAITNKGIVKRAYKDIEKAEITINGFDNISVDGEKVSLKENIGESVCSCPSRSICKHIIMAVIKARQSLETDEKEEVERTELINYPIESALKLIKSKRAERIVHLFKVGEIPEISETSVVSMQIEGERVSLTEPLSVSGCSCKSGDICIHKAEAIIFYKLFKGIITPEQIEEQFSKKGSFDMELVSSAIKGVKEFISYQTAVGLSRTSKEAMNSAERLAVLCHNAGLANLERLFRKLHREYELYFKRSTVFSMESFTELMSAIYRLAEMTEKADINNIKEIAGEFRDEYTYSGTLILNGVTQNRISEISGYEGTEYLFIDEKSGDWYKYSDIRPVFYDRTYNYGSHSPTPWDLNTKKENLPFLRIKLRNTKTTADGKLSSSKETEGEILGDRRLTRELIEKHYFDDFEKLFDEKLTEGSAVVFIKAERYDNRHYDETGQFFSMTMYDKADNHIEMYIKYSKNEKYTINHLERMLERLDNSEREVPCFVGTAYIYNDIIRFYPMTYFDKL